MTERRINVRAVLHALLSVVAVVLLLHDLVRPDGHGGAPPPRPAATPPAAHLLQASLPGDAPVTDADACPRPWENPGEPILTKPLPPPSRHGAHPAHRWRPAGASYTTSRMPVAGATALRRPRPTGPRLPVFRC
ncbi:hypothetical protein [Sphaerisporangium sp. TRM90804]|uniref:hypothetical protein n=1 Tax=Sphaerisporangium sp. TRM90804 TaxID=3031113 RepID=UPI00244D6C95|nr:hypothetical protein [Sphaerisporangium sp. TRM90804]MDH2429141.1 hypothetical protein [Sphaerisporangium sp. TRM90804]